MRQKCEITRQMDCYAILKLYGIRIGWVRKHNNIRKKMHVNNRGNRKKIVTCLKCTSKFEIEFFPLQRFVKVILRRSEQKKAFKT